MVKQCAEKFSTYEAKKLHLLQHIKNSSHIGIQLQKKTASNLFRYVYDKNKDNNTVTVKDFDKIISLDITSSILEVEGLTPYETIVKYTLEHGLLPTVAPELKHITIGGAIVGIGIESTGHQYGFVHDGLLEAEVLLPDGRIILCNPNNEHSDLFFALPNSYGTLGYILRAKIQLYPAKPFVHITTTRFSDTKKFIEAMQELTHDTSAKFIEGLVFSSQELYLAIGRFETNVKSLDDIYRNDIFYKLIQNQKDIYLTTEDYIFRYDPDWFWNIPETTLYNLFRKIAPKSWRNSGFYKKYLDRKYKLLSHFDTTSSLSNKEESLIQDWEVPWEKGQELLEFALNQIDLMGKPWAIIPIKTFKQPTLYPVKPNTLYFNLGSYCSSKRQEKKDSYYNTKIMDSFCFSLGGLKMLYSSTFLTADQFSSLYNGEAYQQLKQKYDPDNLGKSLYNKVNLSKAMN